MLRVIINEETHQRNKRSYEKGQVYQGKTSQKSSTQSDSLYLLEIEDVLRIFKKLSEKDKKQLEASLT